MFKKQKYKLNILLALIVLAASCVMLAACSNVFKPEDNGYSVVVTYDANGGRFDNADSTGIKVYKYAPGKSIIKPGGTQTAQVVAPMLREKHVSDWYPAVLDENGEVIRDSEGNIQVSATPWDFALDRLPETEGYKLYLVAHWVGNFTFTVDVGEEARADGAVNIVNSDYERPGTASRPAHDPVWEGHTFYGYYDADGNMLETEADWRKIEISEANPNAVVYARWIDGNWRIVRTREQLSTVMAGVNYYIDADINFAGRTITVAADAYTGEFNGNGHTISGINFSTRQNATQYNLGLFNFGASGRMHDLIFKDCTVSYTYTAMNEGREYNAGFLCGNGEGLDMANLKNIGFENCTLNITRILNTVGKTVNTGAGTHYEGIFGKLGETQTFVPLDGKADVTVNLT
ncbi:MAG: hypothetical protein K2K80_06410 [Clostridia bacterium]|nr:hypothetical protein [Clostridia bacterium]